MMQYLLAKMALASDRYTALFNNNKPTTPVYTIPSITPEGGSGDANSSSNAYTDTTFTHDQPDPSHTFTSCIHSNSESNNIPVRYTLTSRQHLELCWGLLLRRFGMCDTDTTLPSGYSGTTIATNHDDNTTSVIDKLSQLNSIHDSIISNTNIQTTFDTSGSAPVYDKTNGEYMYDLYALKHIHDEYINTASISNTRSVYNIVYGMIAISYRERPPMTAEEGEAVRSFFGFRARDIIMMTRVENSS